MSRLIAALVALLLLSAPAFADLTDTERRSLRALIDGQAYVGEAERALVANSGGVRRFQAIIGASRELTRAIAILAGTNIGNEASPAAIAEWDALSRDAQVADAWRHVDRVLAVLDAERATAAPPVRLWLDNAAWALRSVDRQLRFADPLPGVPGGVPTAVGPHGHLPLALKRLYFSVHYFRDELEHAWVPKYAAGDDIGPALGQYLVVIEAQHHVIGLLVGVTWTPEEAGEDSFCRTLRVLRLLSVETPRGYLFAAPSALTDSWFHNDKALWALMVFPNSARCGDQVP
jgi:hypothetical protein